VNVRTIEKGVDGLSHSSYFLN